MINLWMEGYRATGDYSPATFCGTYQVDTLREAVMLWMKEPDDRLEKGRTRVDDINLDNLSYWACRFFDNEVDARKRFG